jgi:hypothetical protein
MNQLCAINYWLCFIEFQWYLREKLFQIFHLYDFLCCAIFPWEKIIFMLNYIENSENYVPPFQQQAYHVLVVQCTQLNTTDRWGSDEVCWILLTPLDWTTRAALPDCADRRRRSCAGLTRVGAGGRWRILRPEPWRAWTDMWLFSERAFVRSRLVTQWRFTPIHYTSF